ncbi:salivary cystatin-L [Dermacentor silvarum]|uniref:salivary cystatin-L n=1 Tax=Dermacentor silvarum TaxID=543639 RepID=UPI001896C002|nr:salivary cystatin-L [Dermacentor silvarum]
MAFSGVVAYGMLVVLLAAFSCCTAGPGRLVGGWKKHSVNEKPVFEELAHYAISQQVGGREYFDTVLELVDVDTQLVAGTNYRIKFKVAESTCRVTESYTREACLPKSRESVKDVCTAVIYEVPWLNERSITSFTCEGTSTSK